MASQPASPSRLLDLTAQIVTVWSYNPVIEISGSAFLD